MTLFLLSALFLLSTEISSLACGARRRAPHGLAVLGSGEARGSAFDPSESSTRHVAARTPLDCGG
jgi:hypothetical protein